MHYGLWEEGGPCPDLADLSPSMAAGAVSPLPPFRDVHWAKLSSPWQAFGCPSEPVRPCWPWPSCSPHSASAELCLRCASRSGPAKPVPLPCLLCLHPGRMAQAAGSDGRCCQTPETGPGRAEGPLLPGEDKRLQQGRGIRQQLPCLPQQRCNGVCPPLLPSCWGTVWQGGAQFPL